MQVDNSRRICDAIAKSELDLAIIGGDIPAELADCLQATPYAQDELALILPPAHPAAQTGRIAIAQLYDLVFVSLNQGSTVQAVHEAVLRQHGIIWRHLSIDMVPATPLCLPLGWLVL